MENIEFCECENVTGVYTQTDDFGHWLVCNKCNKPIEDSYEYDNQCDENY